MLLLQRPPRNVLGSAEPNRRVGPWYFLWNGKSPRNRINGDQGTDFGSGLVWQVSRRGVVARPAGTTSSRYYRTTPFPDASQWTVVVQADLTSTANASVGYFTLGASVGATPYFQLVQRSSGASYGVRFNGAPDRITGGTLSLGVHTHVISFDGSTLSYWLDGTLLGTYSATTTGSVSRAITIIGDGSWLFSATSAYPIHAAMFQGSVGEAWAEQAHADIESVLYEPRRIWVPVSVAGGSSPTATTSLDAAIQAARSATASVAAAIQAPGSATATLAAAVQTALSSTASLSAAVQAALTASASLTAAVQVAHTLQAAIDAALQVSHTAQASLDAYIQAGFVASASLDAAIQAARTGSAAIDAAIQLARTATANLSAAIAVSNTVGAAVSAVIQAGRSATASLSAYVFTDDVAATYTVPSRARIGDTPARDPAARIGGASAVNPTRRIGAYRP